MNKFSSWEEVRQWLADEADGYDQGWEDAISEMISKLEGM